MRTSINKTNNNENIQYNGISESCERVIDGSNRRPWEYREQKPHFLWFWQGFIKTTIG